MLYSSETGPCPIAQISSIANAHWFLSLEDTKEKIEIWREEYNTFRPHSCLGDMTPEMFIEKQVKTAEFSTLEHS
jgi:putative transposase